MSKYSLFNLLPFIIAIVDYDYFAVIAIFYILLIHFKKLKVLVNIKTVKFFVLMFYIIRLISGFNLNLTKIWINISQKNYSLQGRFIDLQQVLISINCNSENSKKVFEIVGTEQSIACPYQLGYGPIFEFLNIKIDPWLGTIAITSIILIVLIIYYWVIINNLNAINSYIVSLIFLSPPINFVIERMNIDIIIFLVIAICYKKIKNENLINFIILLLSLIKFYPLIILFINLIFYKLNKLKKYFRLNLLFIILFASITFFSSNENLLNSRQFKVFRSDRTFGLLSEALNFETSFGLKFTIYYIALFIFLLFFIFISKKTFIYSEMLNKRLNLNLVSIFLFLSFLSNYDYRLVCLIFLAEEIIRTQNKVLLYSYLIFIFSSPGLLYSYGEMYKLVEDYYFVYLDFSFYFLISNLLLEYFQFIRKLLIKSNS